MPRRLAGDILRWRKKNKYKGTGFRTDRHFAEFEVNDRKERGLSAPNVDEVVEAVKTVSYR